MARSSIYKKGLRLFRNYFFKSDERITASLMLVGTVLSVIALVALTAAFPWVFGLIWAALSASNSALFVTGLAYFALWAGCMAVANTVKTYLAESLIIRWRKWLTESLLNKLLSDNQGKNNNYLDLARFPEEVDHPQQRIHQDVRRVTKTTLISGLDFISATLRLGIFIGTLWVAGGSLSFILLGTAITIPGYLVWIAIAFALTGTFIKHKMGHKLSAINNANKVCEAEFRSEMELLNNQAESISQEQGEKYYNKSLKSKFKKNINTLNEKLKIKTMFVTFQNLYTNIALILPYIVTAPLYFLGLTNIEKLMQIGLYFGEVTTSLGWFADSYETLSAYQTSINRLDELEKSLDEGGEASKHRQIIFENKENNAVDIENLNLAIPKNTGNTEYIFKKLNLKFKPKENTLIRGNSGLGKSTFFKAMAGSWRYGEGKIGMPQNSKIMFLAQKPSLPNDSLRAVLAYPKDRDTYTDKQYIKVLKQVGNMEELISQLDVVDQWSRRLSPGQQQRISFARALLAKPDWLFLDETTASLDPDSEIKMYQLVKNKLVNTTFVSIAHRPSVQFFHDKIVNFKGLDENGDLIITEEFSIADEEHKKLAMI